MTRCLLVLVLLMAPSAPAAGQQYVWSVPSSDVLEKGGILLETFAYLGTPLPDLPAGKLSVISRGRAPDRSVGSPPRSRPSGVGVGAEIKEAETPHKKIDTPSQLVPHYRGRHPKREGVQ